MLLGAGADPSVDALHNAVRYGCGEIVRKLLDAGANAAGEGSGFTPLHAACSCCSSDPEDPVSAEIVRMLLDAGADATARDEGGGTQIDSDYCRAYAGSTPLHEAAYRCNAQIARMLLAAGADAGAVSDGGNTPLHFAAARGSEEVVGLLLDLGVPQKPETRNPKSKPETRNPKPETRNPKP